MAGSNFTEVIHALENASRPDADFLDTLKWDETFRRLYAQHVEAVVSSSPAFAPLGLNLELRFRRLMELASLNGGIALHDVEAVTGVTGRTLKAFLSHFDTGNGEALLFLGGGHVVTIDYTNIAKEGVH